jgi:hypothetical protein
MEYSKSFFASHLDHYSKASSSIIFQSMAPKVIVDTGSAITIIHQDLLKTIHHTKFLHKPRSCATANSTPLNIIGQIELEIKLKHITTYITADVATNLITNILLGYNWINLHHVHLFGDQQRLTIPEKNGQLVSIPYKR